jgi:hypothetical protein
MGHKVDCRIIKTWDENIAAVAKEFFDVNALKAISSKLSDKYDYVTDMVQAMLKEQAVAEVRQKYDEEFGDPELWDDYLKKQHLKPYSSRLLGEALRLCSERYIDVVGMTVGHVFELAMGFGMFSEGDTVRRRRRRGWCHVHKSEGDFEIPAYMPLNLVIPPEPPQLPAMVDEEDE